MVTESILLGLAGVLVWAAIASRRHSLLFIAVGSYATLTVCLAFIDLVFLAPAAMLAVGLELYGLGVVLRSSPEEPVTAMSFYMRHNPA